MKKKSRSENVMDFLIGMSILAIGIAGSKLLSGWYSQVFVGIGFAGVAMMTEARILSHTSVILAGVGGAAIGTMIGIPLSNLLGIDPSAFNVATLFAAMGGAGGAFGCIRLLLRAERWTHDALLQSFSIPRAARLELIVPKGITVPVGVAVASAKKGEMVEVNMTSLGLPVVAAASKSDSLEGVSVDDETSESATERYDMNQTDKITKAIEWLAKPIYGEVTFSIKTEDDGARMVGCVDKSGSFAFGLRVTEKEIDAKHAIEGLLHGRINDVAAHPELFAEAPDVVADVVARVTGRRSGESVVDMAKRYADQSKKRVENILKSAAPPQA